SSTGSTVSIPASEPGGREFYPGLCSCSVFAIICNEFDTANLLQVRFMVTSELSLTCCKLTASLHTCHDKFVANLHSCHDKFVASLLQTKIAIWVIHWNEKTDLLAKAVTESHPFLEWVAYADIISHFRSISLQKTNHSFQASKYQESIGNIPTMLTLTPWLKNRREDIIIARLLTRMIITPGAVG
ncbi:hypothetical protein AVEN_163641-1, partial [Araneus ventricosus]